MVGNIICPMQFESAPFNPDDYFDPTTHIATEANFIKLLEDGIYDSSLIGYKVNIYNGQNGGNFSQVIADVNHDAENTGQTNCYDLISDACALYGSISATYGDYRHSYIRRTILNNYYSYFGNDIKSHIINIKYNSQGSWYNDDKIIIPSFIEVNGTVDNGGWTNDYDVEGVVYPIFLAGKNSRIKTGGNYSQTQYWWTRTGRKDNGSYSGDYWWGVEANGNMNSAYYYSADYYIAPLMRVQ